MLFHLNDIPLGNAVLSVENMLTKGSNLLMTLARPLQALDHHSPATTITILGSLCAIARQVCFDALLNIGFGINLFYSLGNSSSFSALRTLALY